MKRNSYAFGSTAIDFIINLISVSLRQLLFGSRSISENTGNITKDEFYESMVGTAPDKERIFFVHKHLEFLE
jgi:hypothetical protein